MTFAPKRILVATDFSAHARAAADAAAELARRFDAQLTLLHVVPLSSYVEYAAGIEASSLATAELQAAVRTAANKSGAAELARLRASGLRVDEVTLDGPAPAEICTYASSAKVDLIVIGSHGNTGLKRFLLGSVAENVVRHAAVPVLVIREAVR